MTYEQMSYAYTTLGRLAITLACINHTHNNITRQYGIMGKKD